jgi:hypothetical protein
MPGGATTTTISLQVLGITDDGKLWHTSQSVLDNGSMGSWSSWEEVKPKGVNAPGFFVSVDCASTWNSDLRSGGPYAETLHVLGAIRTKGERGGCVAQQCSMLELVKNSPRGGIPEEN